MRYRGPFPQRNDPDSRRGRPQYSRTGPIIGAWLAGRPRRGLAALVLRLALLGEGERALARVLGAADLARLLGLDLQAFLEGQVPSPEHGLFHCTHGQRPAAPDLEIGRA